RQIAKQAHDHDFANLESEAYRVMALYQKDSADAAELLDKAEAELKGEHKVPQALINEAQANVLRARVERALRDKKIDAAQAFLKQLDDAAAGSADDVVQSAYHGAAGEVLLAQGNFTEAISHLEEDEANPISMRALETAYEKSGQKDSA